MAVELNKDEQLRKLYYDPKQGFSNSNKFYLTVKNNNLNFTHKQINEFVKKQSITQIFKPIRKQKLFSTITVPGIRAEYQMDLMIYDRFEYHNYKYIFVIVDIHSRYACARAMTNRENTTIMNNMISMFDDDMGGKPKSISCDNEFNTTNFKTYCIENDINVIFSEPYDILKNSIVERLNRTLADYMKKMRLGKKQYDWVKHLPDIMQNYNNSYHRTIRNTPFNIFLKGGENGQDVLIVPRNLKIGDSVRVNIKKRVFEKGDRETYSREVFKIVGQDDRRYLLDDGSLYPGRKLTKVDPDVQFDILPENNDEETKHNERLKVKKISKNVRLMGVDPTNQLPIDAKRKRNEKLIF